MLALPLVLSLVACSDTYLNEVPDDKTGVDSADTGEPTVVDTDYPDDGECVANAWPQEDVVASDACDYDIGGFKPVIEWEVEGGWCSSLPVVGDLNRDGMPEIIVNQAGLLTTGELQAWSGDGSRKLWETTSVNTGFGAHPAIADIDDDGYPEVLVVREYTSSLFGAGDFSVVMLDYEGNIIGESERFVDAEMDYATGIAVSDMDHDGSPEIVAGRAILNADLTTRGVGDAGRGCNALVNVASIYGEGGNPAIADMDLDGVEEVVVGNAFYDPDGRSILNVRGGKDGGVAVGNFDGDPEAEFVRVTYNELAAYDTDGTELYVLTNPTANILSTPTVGDVDNDGKAEIITAGGNFLWVLNAEDGSMLWQAKVHDESGATGASLFDFDADGVLEVVYEDELNIYAFNGTDGTIKFQTDEHGSDTMYDYPVIADVDADGHAEVVVCHDGFYPSSMSVYGDETNSWAPVRDVWNQQAYTITNINDDLSVPETQTQNFTVYNSFHSNLAGVPGQALDELESEILDVCLDDCDIGYVLVTARGKNTGNADLPAGVTFALYARTGSTDTLVASTTTTALLPALKTSETLTFTVAASDLAGADALWLVIDDDGTGTSHVAECVEDNNGWLWKGPFCE